MKNIIFDIDDTLTYETDFLKKYAPKYLQDNYNISAVIVNENGYNLDEIYGLKNYWLNKGKNEKEAIEMAKKMTNDFWNKHFIKYNVKKLREGTKQVIKNLKKEGYQIHLLSLRGKKTKENDSLLNEFIRLKVVPLITKISLLLNGIKYDKLVLVKNEDEKLNYIKNYNPDLLFDDQSSIIEKARFKGKKVCISTSHNINKEFSDEVIRLSNFNEDIEKIKEYITPKESKIKNLHINKNLFYKIYTENSQSIVKLIAKNYFVNHYQPIVIGNEKVPNDDGVAFVANHRHKLDPVFISLYSNHSIHWAALLRMFEGKEDLFSGTKAKFKCNLSAGFITAMGAKPIARKTDENYEQINLKTIQELTDLLEDDSSVGFFPEGTINREPENQNMVPLKSLRIFRMTCDTESYLQPVSIVWIPKELNIKNRVILIFSHPINTRNRNKKEVKDIWQETINLNINKSNQFIKEIENLESNLRTDENVKQKIKKFRDSF